MRNGSNIMKDRLKKLTITLKQLGGLLFFLMIIFFFGSFKDNNGSLNFSAERLLSKDTIIKYPCFLIVSDTHLHHGENQSISLDSNSDSGDDLWEGAKSEIDSVIKKNNPKFLIVLGDFPFHSRGNLSDVDSSLVTVYNDISKIARKNNLPLIIAPGNNDSYTGDYKPLTSNHPVFFQPDTDNVATYANDSLATPLGCYSVFPFGRSIKFRIVILNSTIFSSHKDGNNGVPSYGANQSSDADTEMRWFDEQLHKAYNDSERVLVAMHVPPGLDGNQTLYDHVNKYMWFSPGIQNRFLDLIHDYQDNIIGLLASHTHMDGIRLLRNNNRDSITSILISEPGIAPGHGNNPGIKLITYDPNSFALKNFVTYYMDYWNRDTAPTLKDWDSSFIFSKIAPGYDPSSMNVLEYFRKSCDENCLDQIIDSIYTVKSKNPKASIENKSKYVDYENN
jgi:sphingomyelin phosphodiesterase acid-like 3